MPKSKCCVSQDRCKRCPIRMLKEGSLPEGYTVKKRKLVKVGKKNKVKITNGRGWTHLVGEIVGYYP